MTELVSRPILRVRPTEPTPSRPLALSTLLAVAGTAAVGLISCLAVAVAVWFSGGSGAFGSAVRTGAFGWLVGNGSGLIVEGTALTAVPLGLMCLWGYLLYRTGRWAGAHSVVRGWGDVAAGVAAGTLGYGAAGAAVAVLTSTQTVHAGLVRSAVAPAGLALVLGGLGVLRGTGRGHELFALLPEEVRASLYGGVTGLAVMVASGALLFTASLLVHFGDVTTLAEGAGAGILGGLVLALLGAALVPNAVLSAGAFIAGPGFSLGTGTSVAPGDVHLGVLPAFPLLGALPQGDGSSWWLSALVVLPVLAGAVAGVVAVRHFPVYGVDHAALRGGLAGLLGGVGFAALTALSRGSVGPGRMQDIGPDVWGTMGVCALAFLLGGAVTAAGARWAGTGLTRRSGL
ncbi:MAG: hypothetical protein H0U61_03460 [Nocardioidaceae bacterium]|nr:hypothetical protein [Nocardioidaceae bacterium]